MSTPYPQQPAGQPTAQPYAPAQLAPRGVPQPGMPAQPAPQGVPQMGMPAQPAPQGTNTYPGGVPAQGYPQAYAVGPQVSMSPRVSWLPLGAGIAGWVIVGLTVLVMLLAIRAAASDPDPSGWGAVGFLPLFTLAVMGPVNLVGGVIGLVRAGDKMRKWKLNWLGIVLNASPYVIFFVAYFVLMLIPS